jgi:flagellar protein FlbD
MIRLQRLNREEFILNADYIEMLEATPDTVITLLSGKKLMVKNPIEDIVNQVIAYRRNCNQSMKVITREHQVTDIGTKGSGSNLPKG